jgi:hypothetical protein
MFNRRFTDEELLHPNVTHFEKFALDLMRYQLSHNQVYASYYEMVKDRLQMPYCFLPIEAFKHHTIKTTQFDAEIVFSSSATGGMGQSYHHVKDIGIYHQAFVKGFEHVYGKPNQFVILALLPSYLEREGSSLVYMAAQLISATQHPLSGFYLNDFDALHQTLTQCMKQNRKVILLGVSYALLDFAERHPIHYPELIVMETGGMKGRKKEITRAALHNMLCKGFGTPAIHAEYGMTELLSQAYATQNGKFYPTPTLKIYITDIHDPFAPLPYGKAGRINVVDLANIYSCAFIQTSDIGVAHTDGSFEVLGRLDNSDLRGCSLMYA